MKVHGSRKFSLLMLREKGEWFVGALPTCCISHHEASLNVLFVRADSTCFWLGINM
jgi:hypothetical protein